MNLVFFQALILSTYVDSMYLVWINPPINFTFSDDSVFLKKNLGGGHKFSEFACYDCFSRHFMMAACFSRHFILEKMQTVTMVTNSP